MTTEKGFTLSKPLGALIIVLLGGAFFAGTRANGEAPRGTPEITAAAIAAPTTPVIEAVTAEQVRRLMQDMRELQGKLEETIKQVAELNVRLARIEASKR